MTYINKIYKCDSSKTKRHDTKHMCVCILTYVDVVRAIIVISLTYTNCYPSLYSTSGGRTWS